MKLCFPALSLWLLIHVSTCFAGDVAVPNASFESPDTTYATNRIDSWQKNPQPIWYDEGAFGGPWDLATGVFSNSPNQNGVVIDNIDGEQAAFLFVLPQVGFFQDYNSIDWSDAAPTHEFNATFQAGRTYQLTAGLIGGGGNMREGASLALALYYRDASSNMVVVAMTNVVYSAALFPTNTHFVDFSVATPSVKASDAHVNQHIGIAIFSSIPFDNTLFGGYWDIDNVRLKEITQVLLSVPNASFESPETTYATNRMDSWQKNPEPIWYNEALFGGPWDLATGVFSNSPNQNGVIIDNIDGEQAAFLFVLPQVGFFQDYNSIDWSHTTPTHDFSAKFETGKAYQLSAGLIGGGGNMREGASLALALYYRDASSNMVFVAMTNVVYNATLFPTNTHFVDFSVTSPLVKTSDAYANQQIGIAVFSSIAFDNTLFGGYWDIDNVRLNEIERPRLRTTRIGEVIVESQPGLKFDILASANLSEPLENWTVIGQVENVTGTITFQDPSINTGRRFYIARYAP